MSNPKKNKKKNGKLILGTIFVLIIVAVTVGILIYRENKAKANEITYDQLYQDIIDKKVEKIEMTVGGATVTVKYKMLQKVKKKQLMLIHYNHLWNL